MKILNKIFPKKEKKELMIDASTNQFEIKIKNVKIKNIKFKGDGK